MLALGPKLIVVEATGGYEEELVLALFADGLPVVLVSPQRVRQYARAKGLLGSRDRTVLAGTPGIARAGEVVTDRQINWASNSSYLAGRSA